MNFQIVTFDPATTPNLVAFVILGVAIAAVGVYVAHRSEKARKAGDRKGYFRLNLLAMGTVFLGMIGFLGGIIGPTLYQLNGYLDAGNQSAHNLQVAARDTYGLKLSETQATALLGDYPSTKQLPANHLYGTIHNARGGALATVSLIRKDGRWMLAASSTPIELPKVGA